MKPYILVLLMVIHTIEHDSVRFHGDTISARANVLGSSIGQSVNVCHIRLGSNELQKEQDVKLASICGLE